MSSDNAFESLALAKPLLDNLASLDYHEMTDIQRDSLPLVLAGQDVIAQAKTGSGKTAAFGLGLLQKLSLKRFQVQGLVVCPTRELADQVSKELRRLARMVENVKVVTLCGGMPLGPQIGSLEYGAHIIVGTPGRILKHLSKRTLVLDHVETLVLDEADRMLDMGFAEDIEAIVRQTPASRQTLLFSATYPDAIQAVSTRYLKNPVMVVSESVHTDLSIEEHFYKIDEKQRLEGLATLLGHYKPESSLVFCNTKKTCDLVARHLKDRGIVAIAMHGDLEQRDRDQILVRFSNRSCSVLVATDVAARGLDIKDLDAVINYEVSRDSEVHIHRIGRTGRSGKSGLALNLFTDSELHRIKAIDTYRDSAATIEHISSLNGSDGEVLSPKMVTLQIDAGRKQKLRPGDILGALTANKALDASQIGKIDIANLHAFVAVERSAFEKALLTLAEGKIKGRQFKVRKI